MAQVIASTTRRFRARARWVLFVRQALSMTSVAAAAAGSANLLMLTTWETRAGLLGSALALALVAAAIAAYRRGPNLAETASLMDARLGLQDHVRAALQVEGDEGPVASLIVRAASRQLQDAASRDVFPLAMGRRALVSAFVVGASLLTVSPEAFRSPTPAVEHVQNGQASGSQMTNRVAVTNPQTTATAENAATREEMRPGGEEPPLSQRDAPRAAPAGDSVSSDASPSTAKRGATTAADEAVLRSVSAADAQALTPSGDRGGAAGRRAGAFQSAAISSSATAGNDAAGGGASSGGDAIGAGAGGVAGQPSVAGNLGASAGAVTSPARVTISAARARALADAALARDDIPLSRRQYVREYFLRLQSQVSRP
jgi:hypothetical protein